MPPTYQTYVRPATPLRQERRLSTPAPHSWLRGVALYTNVPSWAPAYPRRSSSFLTVDRLRAVPVGACLLVLVSTAPSSLLPNPSGVCR